MVATTYYYYKIMKITHYNQDRPKDIDVTIPYTILNFMVQRYLSVNELNQPFYYYKMSTNTMYLYTQTVTIEINLL